MLFISTGNFYDKLRPQILSVGTTANSPLSAKPHDKAAAICFQTLDNIIFQIHNLNHIYVKREIHFKPECKVFTKKKLHDFVFYLPMYLSFHFNDSCFHFINL